MKTCTRCGRSGPGATVSEGRTICNTCRKGRVPLQLTAVTPRTPQQIMADRRAQQQAQAQVKERRAMEDRLESLERELGAVRAIGEGEPLGPIVKMAGKASKSEVVPLLVLSDWHVEQEVEAVKLHGLNSYNLEIAKQRAEVCFVNASKLIASAENTSKVGRVFVGLLGDFIDGRIHEELLETALLGPGPALAFAKQLLSRGIRYLLDQHPSLEFSFFCTGGNHARITKKTHISTNAENNLESYMYHHLASDFRDDARAKFFIAEGDSIYSEAFEGYNIRWAHGDAVSFQGGIGGLAVPMGKWILRMNANIRAELTAIGHYHTTKADKDWICNGSLVGYNSYAQRFGMAFEPPQQQFCLIHANRGRTLVANVWCQP